VISEVNEETSFVRRVATEVAGPQVNEQQKGNREHRGGDHFCGRL
jgi:hypothetical protein